MWGGDYNSKVAVAAEISEAFTNLSIMRFRIS